MDVFSNIFLFVINMNDILKYTHIAMFIFKYNITCIQ
jgi:hypothetical protein